MRGQGCRVCAARAPADLSAAGLGRARRQRDRGTQLESRPRRRRFDIAAIVLRISARRRFSGIARRASRSRTHRLAGSAHRVICDELREFEPLFSERTGLASIPIFPGRRSAGCSRNTPGKSGLRTVDSWLIWKLTADAYTSPTSRMHRARCVQHPSRRLGRRAAAHPEIPREILRKLSHRVSRRRNADGIPIAGIAGDQQAALFGQRCTSPLAKNTYGTGCFIVMTPATGRCIATRTPDNNRSSRSICSRGSVFIAGAAIQWLRDSLGIIRLRLM